MHKPRRHPSLRRFSCDCLSSLLIPPPPPFSAAFSCETRTEKPAQLENTVCRVVYVPGPLDPIMPSIRKPRRRPSSSLANGNVGASTPYTSVPLTAKVEEGHQRRREGGTVEQRDQRRWKGVKEGGEREQGIGDDFGGGGRRRSREERMAGGEGVLQLTPTSKNLLRYKLRHG